MSRSEARGLACEPFQGRGVPSWSVSWTSTFHAVSMHPSFMGAFGCHDVFRRMPLALLLLDARQDALPPCFMPLGTFAVGFDIPAVAPGFPMRRTLPHHHLHGREPVRGVLDALKQGPLVVGI